MRCIVSFTTLFCLTRGIIVVVILGTSCFVEFCGPCMTVVHFKYNVSDFNYTDIISSIQAEVGNPLNICR